VPVTGHTRSRLVFTGVICFLAGLALGTGYQATHPSVRLDTPGSGGGSTFQAFVTKVIDGDTIVLENGMHLRYRNIDTPEMLSVKSLPQPFAVQATEFNRSLVQDRTVTVRLSPGQTDRYGRLVGSVEMPDGRTVENMLVEEGLAKVVPYDDADPNLGTLYDLQASARSSGKGLWVKKAHNVQFVASSASPLFHLSTCPIAAQISENNRVFFQDEAAARASGRTPCKQCMGQHHGNTREQTR